MTDNVYKKQIGGSHYSMPIQPAEFVNKNNIPFAEGNAIKYLCRHKKRGQKQDLLKAIHYIELELQHTYAVDPQGNSIDSLSIDCDAIDYEMFLQEQYDFYVKQNVGENILKYDEWLIENEKNLKEEFIEYGQQV